MQNYRVNQGKSVKNQEKELDLKRKQTYRVDLDESVKAQEEEVN